MNLRTEPRFCYTPSMIIRLYSYSFIFIIITKCIPLIRQTYTAIYVHFTKHTKRRGHTLTSFYLCADRYPSYIDKTALLRMSFQILHSIRYEILTKDTTRSRYSDSTTPRYRSL